MEPDLGLGSILAVEGRNLRVHFPGPEEERLYDGTDAPLQRCRLQPGGTIPSSDGELIIEEVLEKEGLLSYRTQNGWLPESELPPYIDPQGPRDMILDGSWGISSELDLRRDAIWAEHHLRSRSTLGLQGGRIRLYPHQLDSANELCQRPRVRAMLADEVGLGKTIEALLIAHRLLLSERILRILIVVPESLIHQWFAEAWLRFNLPFRLLDEGFLENLEDEEQGLLSQTRVICSQEQLQLSDFSKESWDLLIVDEVHRIDSQSQDGQELSQLCSRIPHVLLLSATPADMNSEEHFLKLSWLEPDVYLDINQYREHQNKNRLIGTALAELTQSETNDLSKLLSFLPGDHLSAESNLETILNSVLDLHGPAYHLVKHTRKTVEGFPLRKVNLISLEGDAKRLIKEWRHEKGDELPFRYQGLEKDPRVIWLKEFLDQLDGEKLLVLVTSRLKVEALTKGLESLGLKDLARFHEGLSLIERDRQAAWFSQEDGPSILISSNLGAEGRNFQVASHLVLMDLSTDPALLEQRIGRLDRIGQERDVTIHLPIISGSPQEGIVRWHHQAFDGFETPWCGVDTIHRDHEASLIKNLERQDPISLDGLIKESQSDYQNLLKKLEFERDHLLEKVWHHPDRSHELEAKVVQEDQDPTLEDFMLQAWEMSGIDAIPLSNRSYRLKANNGYGHPFPGFREHGMSVTFHRPKALKRDDLTFLSWDHPMVRDSIVLLSTGRSGKASVVEVPSSRPNLLLDLCFRVHHSCPSRLHADRFFPPTPIQITLDREGRPIRLKLDGIRKKLKSVKSLPLAPDDIMNWLDGLLSKGEASAKDKASELSLKAEDKRVHEDQRFQRRLEGLIRLNPSISPNELQHHRRQQTEIKKGLSEPVIELDSIRIIICRPEK